jgi:DNA-directed RNA polymerase subunit RPC12/RpoP
VEFVFFALVFGVAAGIIGRMKGGSFFIWFLVGAALPGVGILAALLMRNERAEPRRRCPECGNVVAVSDQVCMRCGRDLDFPEEVAPRAGNPV